MKRNTMIFLQVIITLIGLGVLGFMLWEPRLEGVNVGKTLFEIYFKDPFIAYAYLASIIFFTALYNAIKVLGFAGRNELLSQKSMKALQSIKYCGQVLIVFILGGEVWIFIANGGRDDIAGGVFMGLIGIVVSGTIAIVASRVEKNLRLQ